MESNQNLIRANKQPAYSVTKTDGMEHSVGEAGSQTAAIREMKAHETLTTPLRALAQHPHSGLKAAVTRSFQTSQCRATRWDKKAGSSQMHPPTGPGGGQCSPRQLRPPLPREETPSEEGHPHQGPAMKSVDCASVRLPTGWLITQDHSIRLD